MLSRLVGAIMQEGDDTPDFMQLLLEEHSCLLWLGYARLLGRRAPNCIRIIFVITVEPAVGGNLLRHSGQLTCPEAEHFGGQFHGGANPVLSYPRRPTRVGWHEVIHTRGNDRLAVVLRLVT